MAGRGRGDRPAVFTPGQLGGGELDVGEVLGVDPIPDQRDREGDRTGQQAGHGHTERDPEVVGQLFDVPLGQAGECGREWNQGPHQAEGRSHPDQDPGPLQPLHRAVVVVGEALGDPVVCIWQVTVGHDRAHRIGHRAVPGDRDELRRRPDRVAPRQQVAGLGHRLLEAEETPQSPAPELGQEDPDLDDRPPEPEQGEDEHRPPERVRDGEKEFLDRQGNQRF